MFWDCKSALDTPVKAGFQNIYALAMNREVLVADY